MNSQAHLTTAASRLGFTGMGVVSASPARRLEAYLQWVERQFHGAMGYLARPDRIERRVDLQQILPGAKSIICVARDYAALGPSESELQAQDRGRIAAYAWQPDYHDTMLPRLEELAEQIPGEKHLAYIDTGAILERDHAETAGLGFTGKNTMLIAPRRGSWCFLGEILTTAELEPTAPRQVMPSCGSCSKCLAACPTDAFPAPYVLDARRCISYLTIELKGSIPHEFRRPMGNWVFGCDDCQTVCPFNRFADCRAELTLDHVAPPLETWLTMTQDAFMDTYRGTPLFRTGLERMRRNACVAAGNSADASLQGALEQILRTDGSALVRGHAAWALGRFRDTRTLRAALGAETVEEVLTEINLALGASPQK